MEFKIKRNKRKGKINKDDFFIYDLLLKKKEIFYNKYKIKTLFFFLVIFSLFFITYIQIPFKQIIFI